MHKLYVVAAALLIASLSSPTSAITFPSLTTIYVGPGVSQCDTGGGGVRIATAFSCSNVSGQTAFVRFLVLGQTGSPAGSSTQSLAHGANVTVSTAAITILNDIPLNTGTVTEGTVNIESTQSGVFCTAMVVDPGTLGPNGVALHLVRVNGHPGAQE